MTVEYTRKSIIDFTSYVAERTANFTGREWVFQSLNDWLAKPGGPRFFLLAGEPGSGKTAIASRLTQFAQGSVLPPDGLAHFTHNFLSAIHFCSARDNRWINPHVFAESLAIQLAERYPSYAKALAEKSGDRQVRIEVQQQIEQGQAVGVMINQLVVSGATPEDTFNRVVQEPLETFFRSEFDQQVIILVDALDEALSYSGNVNIVSLLAHVDELPAGVRFILTSRQDERVENEVLDAEELVLSSPQFDQHNQLDIQQFVQNRLRDDQELAKKAVQVTPSQIIEMVKVVSRRSEGNFQYVHFLLDAIAKDLRPFTDLEGLPEGLDELYFDSLERVVKLGKRDWFSEYAPLMGVLSVTQESLTLAQLQAFTRQSEMSVWQYLNDLEQFIEEIKPQDRKAVYETRYRLYHQSVVEFLQRQSRAIKKRLLRNRFYLSAAVWHKKMADECERGNLAPIWEDVKRDPIEQGRRKYARKYYITHLYRAQEWERLFEVLDTVEYGQAKVRDDVSTRSYAQDLELGQQAAVWEGWTVEEGIALLPHLWQYTLLRSSLTSWADQYPVTAFPLLVLLKRKREALGLAELLTNPAQKASAFLLIIEQVLGQASQQSEWPEAFMEAYEIAQAIQESNARARALGALSTVLAKRQQWERAEALIHTIEKGDVQAEALWELWKALAQAQQWERAHALWRAAETMIHALGMGDALDRALREMGRELTQAQQWEQAQEVAYSIEDSLMRITALGELGKALAQAQQWEHAELIWSEAEAAVHTIEEIPRRASALVELGRVYVQTQQWERAEVLIRTIESSYVRARAMQELGRVYAQTQQQEQAELVWREAEALIHTIERADVRVRALRELGTVQQWERARAMRELGSTLVQAQQWEQAQTAWKETINVISTIEDSYVRVRAMQELGMALAQAQQWEQAETLWRETEAVIDTIEAENMRARAMGELGMVLAQAQRWEQAEAVVRRIRESNERDRVSGELGGLLIQAQRWEQAEAVINRIWYNRARAAALGKLRMALAQAQQWERAEALLKREADKLRLTPGKIGYNQLQVAALGELGVVLAQAQQWEQAETLWKEVEKLIRTVEWGNARDRVLRELGIALALGQQWERAEALISTIEDSRVRVKVLIELGTTLAQAQQWERAQAVWREVEAMIPTIGIDKGTAGATARETASRELGRALAQAQQWERAEAVIRRIESDHGRVWALVELGTSLAQAQQWERAQALIRTLERADARVSALGKLERALARAQKQEQAEAIWSEAEAVVQSVEKDDERSWALKELGRALAQAQLWERAEAVIHTMEANSYRGMALEELKKALAQAQPWERAEAMIRTIEDSGTRVRMLIELGTTLAQAQQWERAQAMWREAEALIPTTTVNGYVRDGVLGELGRALAQAQQWEQAEALIPTIVRSYVRDGALGELGRALAQAQQWKRAEAVIRTIEDNDARIAALRELAAKMAAVSEHKQLLRWIQRLWLQVGTREEALNLFSLATEFIPTRPEIGIAFCEALDRVDILLEG